MAPAGLSTGEPPAGPSSGVVDAGNPAAAAGGPAGATDASGAAGLPPAPEAVSGPAASPPDPVPAADPAADGPDTTTAMSATSAASPAPPEVEPTAPLTKTGDPSPTGSATGDPASNDPATDESSPAGSATATDDPASLTAASAADDGADTAGVPPAAVTATPALGDTLRVPCAFGPGLAGWTVAESGGTALGRGTVVADGADFVLQEGDSFATTVARDLTLSAHPGWVVFEYAGLAFDETDADAINDAFEVALLDARDRPLVPTIGVGGDQPKRDAFFNVTEGVGVAHGAGVEVIADPGDPTAGTVRLDVSKLAPGGTARIVFRLVNNDADTGTTVRIIGCADVPPVAGVDLANDTAPTGPGSEPYRADRLTSDPRVSGTATDDGGVAKLEARVGSGAWSDIIASLQPDGTFTFDPGALPAGPVTVTIRATDASGQATESATSFVVNAAPVPAIGYDPRPPARATWSRSTGRVRPTSKGCSRTGGRSPTGRRCPGRRRPNGTARTAATQSP